MVIKTTIIIEIFSNFILSAFCFLSCCCILIRFPLVKKKKKHLQHSVADLVTLVRLVTFIWVKRRTIRVYIVPHSTIMYCFLAKTRV